MQEVLFSKEQAKIGNIGIISLNRPAQLNALSHNMIKAISHQLIDWQEDNTINCIVIQSEHTKAFCAGGDLKELIASKKNNEDLSKYFFTEYRLNRLIGTYPKPIISILDGYTMGGGVGLGMHARYPIATEKFVFAMPETIIGLFPDVGGRLILANLPKRVGTYLALTSSKVNIEQAKNVNLVKYYLPCSELNNFKQALYTLSDLHEIDGLCQNFLVETGEVGFDNSDQIEQHFSHDTVEGIMQSLQADGSEWSLQTIGDLKKCSPTSLKVSLMALRLAEHQTLDDCLFSDYRIINRMLAREDFFEGIRAKIIDKDNNPKWRPDTLEQLPTKEIMEFFEPLEQEISWI